MFCNKAIVFGAVAAAGLQAAVFSGTVVEHQTGKYLARATIVAQPIAGTPGTTISMRTSVSGVFEFSSLAAGWYTVRVTRLGFMPVEYGQKRWNSAGMPMQLTDNSPTFVSFRMPRWSAISGTVVDGNEIGLPEHDVVVYRNTRPPVETARAKSDERGVYRVSGLDPGTYLVRTAGAQDEEGTFLPTFGRESINVENARLVQVDLDQQANNIDVRPLPGQLFTVWGEAGADPPFTPTRRVTIATDVGRQSVTTTGPFRFAGLTPVPYEIYVEAPANDDPDVKLQGIYQSSSLRADIGLRLPLSSKSNGGFEIRGGPARSQAREMRLEVRRKDLAGEGEITKLPTPNGRDQLPPGRWDVRLIPPAGYHVSAFQGKGGYRAGRTRPEGWNEIVVDGYGGNARFTLTAGGGSITGVVKSGVEPVGGAPVYLEGWDPTSRQRVVEPRVTRTDLRGNYTFRYLPPGAYRVLATFEYRDPDVGVFDTASAPSLRVEANGEETRDLDLWVIR